MAPILVPLTIWGLFLGGHISLNPVKKAAGRAHKYIYDPWQQRGATIKNQPRT
jgi:hypothetical protein